MGAKAVARKRRPDAHTPFPWCCAPRPDARLAGAASVVSLLVRAALFLATTLFPFCLTFYFGKTPMFYLPPSDSPAAAASASRAAVLPASQKRMAPGGFELPQNPTHAWGMINETYLGPLGWLLSMTAAPRGESSVLRLHLHLRRAQRRLFGPGTCMVRNKQTALLTAALSSLPIL